MPAESVRLERKSLHKNGTISQSQIDFCDSPACLEKTNNNPLFLSHFPTNDSFRMEVA